MTSNRAIARAGAIVTAAFLAARLLGYVRAVVLASIFGTTSDLDMKEIGALAPTLMADRQARRGVMAPWANGKNAKEYRAALGQKPVVGIFSVGMEEPYRWKDSVQGDAAKSRSGLWTGSPTEFARGSLSSPAHCTTAAG